MFTTSDGYTLYLINGNWVNTQNPEEQEFIYPCGPDGMPWETWGDGSLREPLDGTLVDENGESRVVGEVSGPYLQHFINGEYFEGMGDHN